MMMIKYRGELYKESEAKGTDSLATWLETKGVEIDLRFRSPSWQLSIQGPGHNVSASGKSLQEVLTRGCKLYGRVKAA